jgi:hypothetical protein
MGHDLATGARIGELGLSLGQAAGEIIVGQENEALDEIGDRDTGQSFTAKSRPDRDTQQKRRGFRGLDPLSDAEAIARPV